MTYVLHYAPDNASLIIRLALETRGLPYRARLVDRANAEQGSAAYLQLNPSGRIPVLETPDGTIFETAAILLWLEDRHGQAQDRVELLKWLFFTSNTFHSRLCDLFYHHRLIDGQHAHLLIPGLNKSVLNSLAILDRADSPAFGQDTPGIIDFYIAACLRWCALYGPDDRSWFDLTRYPNLHALAQRVETLPAAAAIQTAEGLGLTPFSCPSHPNPPEGSAL